MDDAKADDIKIHALNGRIVVEGAEGESVAVYDITGSIINHEQTLFNTGVYLVKVGNRPAQKIFVVR